MQPTQPGPRGGPLPARGRGVPANAPIRGGRGRGGPMPAGSPGVPLGQSPLSASASRGRGRGGPVLGQGEGARKAPVKLDVASMLGDGSDMGPVERRHSFAPNNNPRRNTIQLKGKLTATSLYSSRESETIQEVLKFLALRVPGSIQFMFDCIDKSEQPAFGAALINASFAKNFTLPMLQDLLYDEFESNSSPGKEILRENGIVIQFLKAYLSKEYLLQLFGNVVHQICVTEKKISYEIDPNKVDREEVATNTQAFMNKLNYIIQIMTSQEMIDAMPLGIRLLCQMTARLSRQFRPSHEKIYVGSLLLLRYMNPALFTPESCGLLPAGKAPPPVSRRNLILITKVLQNISNGVSFSKKEAFMSTLCLDGWKDLIYDYFDKIINFSFDPTTISSGEKVKIEAGSLHVVHSIACDLKAELCEMVRQAEGDEGLKDFKALLDRLGSYSSNPLSGVDESHQAQIKAYLDSKQSGAYYIGYANMEGQGRVIVLVGSYRIVIMNLACKPIEEAHHFTIAELSSHSTQKLQLVFNGGSGFGLTFDDNSADQVISSIIRAYEQCFAGIGVNSRFKFVVSPRERLDQFQMLSDSYAADALEQPCSGLVATYRAMCSLYSVKPSDALCWDLANLFTGASIINFEKFTDYYEEPLTEVTVNPLLHALGINKQFSQVIIKNMKFTSDSNFRGLAEMMKHTTTMRSLTLNGVIGLSPGAARMVFGTLKVNNFLHLTKLSLPFTQISEPAAAQSLGDYFAHRSTSFKELILTGAFPKSSCTAAIIEGINANPGCVKDLEVFHMARNKLNEVSYTFCQLIKHCKSLTELDVSWTDIPLPDLSMNGTLLKLKNLVLHNNKFTKPQSWDGFVEFLANTQHNIREVNISGTNVPPQVLADMLSIKEGNFAIDASCNNIGKSGVQKVCEAIPRMRAVDKLSLADNAVTDVGLVAVIDALCNNTTMTWVDLSDNFENNNDLVISKLVTLVNSICPLEAIHIKSTGNHGKFKDANKFLYAIGQNARITELNISGHGVGDRGAIALARVLQQNNTLTAVYFDDNNIGELGLRNLADAVPRARSLREMPIPFADVARIMIGMDGGQARNFSKQLADIERELSSRRFRDVNAGL